MPTVLFRRRAITTKMITDEEQRVSVSILQYLGPANSGSCGYCKRGRRNRSSLSATSSSTENDEPSFSLGK